MVPVQAKHATDFEHAVDTTAGGVPTRAPCNLVSSVPPMPHYERPPACSHKFRDMTSTRAGMTSADVPRTRAADLFRAKKTASS